MAAPATEEKNYITLTTSDGADVKVEREVAERSILIKNLLEDIGGETTDAIPIPNVSPRHILRSHESKLTFASPGQRSSHEEGPRVVRAAPKGSSRYPRRRLGFPQEIYRH